MLACGMHKQLIIINIKGGSKMIISPCLEFSGNCREVIDF